MRVPTISDDRQVTRPLIDPGVPSGVATARGPIGRVPVFASVSRLAAMLGITRRALRYYEQVGLLDPVRSPTLERHYSPEQVDRARHIVRLRRLDLPLGEIKASMTTHGVSRLSLELEAVVLESEARLELQLDEIRRLRADMEVHDHQ